VAQLHRTRSCADRLVLSLHSHSDGTNVSFNSSGKRMPQSTSAVKSASESSSEHSSKYESDTNPA